MYNFAQEDNGKISLYVKILCVRVPQSHPWFGEDPKS
jgi:hypothetical protein